MFTFKKIGLFLLLFTLTLSLTGLSCRPGQKEELAGGQEVTLEMWGVFDSAEVFAPIIADYQQDHPNVKINYTKKDYNEYEDDSLNALAQGEGPDIWMIRNDWVARHQKKLVPMPDGLLSADDDQKRTDVAIFENQFVPVVSQDAVIDGKIYGFPLYVDTLALYYNTDIFDQKKDELYEAEKDQEAELLEQPPSDWTEVIKVSKLLTKKSGNNIEQAGIALGTSNNIDQAVDILYALMLQNHTQMVADDKKSATFNLTIKKETGQPVYAGTEALEFYTAFSNTGKESYAWNNSMLPAAVTFAQGKLAMMIDYSFRKNALLQTNPNLKYSVAPLPQIEGETTATDYASYWLETVTKKSSHPEVAWDFINFLVNKSLSEYLSATGRPSPLRNTEVPEVNQRVEQAGDTFAFQAMTAKSWYKGLYPLKVDKIFSNLIDNVTIYNQAPQNAIDTAAAEVTDLLRR